ncbi:hypothetical protein CTAYLR_006286 [Chrysophaeum taylorii]|uniref:JmjC domain-containing protein n=1 Tax=Chrysophaeum taylorii TaxID=2483200 RepID=A0AAD7UM85_9STRA|nr:hypothetical protein CTAYLR_006286 [Chrysophaeum taylorii]
MGKKKVRKQPPPPQRGIWGLVAAAIVAGVWAWSSSRSSDHKCLPVAEVDVVFFSQDYPVPPCPLVVRKVAPPEAWWATLRRLGGDRVVSYDVHAGGTVFTYWDNRSLLAAAALEAGAPRTHERVTATRARMLRDVVQNRSVAARFGGTVEAVAPELAAMFRQRYGHLAPVEPGANVRTPGIWLGGRHTASSPHYDSFHNLHVVLEGPKYVDVWPPTSLDAYPATHPSARQARADFTTGSETELAPGDAIFLPAGWIHRFSAKDAPVLALSLTALPAEFSHFGRWIRSKASMPFWDDAAWTVGRLASTLRVFLPRLARLLEAESALAAHARSYSDDIRKELGIARSPDACPWPDQPLAPRERQRALDAAALVADIFKTRYRPWLRPLYFPPYVENVLTKLNSREGTSPVDAIASGIFFLDACLLPEMMMARGGPL